jgi:peptide/nickel transport system substrate-binding protein
MASRKLKSGHKRANAGAGASTTGSLSRREFMAWAAGVGVASPLLLGLGVPSSSFAADAAQPRKGGSLVMVISGDPPTLSADVTTGVPDVSIGSLVYDGLTRIDENFKPVPNLAESWTISPDNTRYTFRLVQTKWHDGRDFTSKDVKFTLEEISAKYGAKFAATASHIKSITTPDARTVVIDLDKPFGPLLFSLSNYTNAAIMPEHLFAGTNILTNPTTLMQPVGTGPFMFKEWSRGQYVKLVRNPNYWRPGKPYLDEIIFKEIPDPASRVLALKAGEVDYIYFYFFPIAQFADVAQDPQLQIRERGVPEDHLIIFNVRKAPFDNVKVRQALFTAIDREYIRKVVYQGLGAVMKSAINTNLGWAYNPNVDLAKAYPFNPQRAAAMLDEAGFKAGADGKRFDLHLVYDSTDPSNGALSQVLQSMWGKIGVRVIFEGSTRNVELKQVYTDWNFDATLQAYSTSGDPALGVARLYVSSAIKKAPFVNASGYSNPEVDKLFDEGANATTLADRGEAYKKVQSILARDLPVFPMWQTALVNVASKKVRGTWSWSTGYDYWEEVWLES